MCKTVIDKEGGFHYFLNMLTKEQLHTLHLLLDEEKEKLVARLKESRSRTDFGSDVDSFEEESDEAEEFSNKLGIEQLIEEKLENIEHALQKMEKNAYGPCEKCGTPIAYELLSINPESRLCKACKAK